MLRRMRRNVRICLLLVCAALALKLFLPEAGRRIGAWISGEPGNEISRAVSGLLWHAVGRRQPRRGRGGVL